MELLPFIISFFLFTQISARHRARTGTQQQAGANTAVTAAPSSSVSAARINRIGAAVQNRVINASGIGTNTVIAAPRSTGRAATAHRAASGSGRNARVAAVGSNSVINASGIRRVVATNTVVPVPSSTVIANIKRDTRRNSRAQNTNTAPGLGTPAQQAELASLAKRVLSATRNANAAQAGSRIRGATGGGRATRIGTTSSSSSSSAAAVSSGAPGNTISAPAAVAAAPASPLLSLPPAIAAILGQRAGLAALTKRAVLAARNATTRAGTRAHGQRTGLFSSSSAGDAGTGGGRFTRLAQNGTASAASSGGSAAPASGTVGISSILAMLNKLGAQAAAQAANGGA